MTEFTFLLDFINGPKTYGKCNRHKTAAFYEKNEQHKTTWTNLQRQSFI